MLGGGVDRLGGCSAAIGVAAVVIAMTVSVPVAAAALALAVALGVALAGTLTVAFGLGVVLAAGFRVGCLATVRSGFGAFDGLLQGSVDLLPPMHGVQAAGDYCLGGRACSRRRKRRQGEPRQHLEAKRGAGAAQEALRHAPRCERPSRRDGRGRDRIQDPMQLSLQVALEVAAAVHRQERTRAGPELPIFIWARLALAAAAGGLGRRRGGKPRFARARPTRQRSLDWCSHGSGGARSRPTASAEASAAP